DGYILLLCDQSLLGKEHHAALQQQIFPRCLSKPPRVVLLSEFGREEEESLADTLVAAHLTKPVHCSLLFDTLMNLFGVEVEALSRIQQQQALWPTQDQRLQGAHLLLVEDNSINQQVACEILRSAGCVVEVANNGREALAMIAAHDYDGVLMDIQMPEMDGYTATRQLRAEERYRALPIIAMTAHAMSGDREKSLAAGMNDHVCKPIHAPTLFAALQRWLSPNNRPATETGAVVREPSLVTGVAVPLDAIPSMDVAAALQRMNHNHALLRTILADFLRDYQQTAEEVVQALSGRRKADKESARRLVHSVKGSSGNLSAEALYQAATLLEVAIREEQWAESSPLLERFQKYLQRFLQEIDHFLHAAPAQTAADPDYSADGSSARDWQELLPELQKFHLQLCQSDFTAQHTFDGLHPLLGEHLPVAERALWQQLASSMEQFAFAEAAAILRQIAEGLSLSWEDGLPERGAAQGEKHG
ncbi:response regulator, partial [Candidatus Magnetaquicoccus inordinatus]|uniref:response regulator n=1 Tax=Candidatus Magnetaquicoccus inordinatus TaxID=2496818 RepID=UPI00102C7829